MTEQSFDINKLRVAAPCSVPWDAMTGDNQVRRCHSCELNIYNTAEMTKSEIERLISTREGRLCIRLYQRADGTVLTKDCPVGVRAYQKRVARLAGAAFTAILGLFSVSFGQKEDKKAVDAAKLKITRTVSTENVLSGTIFDPTGAVIPNAEILLYKDKIKVAETGSDENGFYTFSSLLTGVYTLEVRSGGFRTYKVKKIKINDNETLGLDIELKIGDLVTVGLFFDSDPATTIDMSSTSVKTTITKKMMEKQP